jgi:hypothetical protein
MSRSVARVKWIPPCTCSAALNLPATLSAVLRCRITCGLEDVCTNSSLLEASGSEYRQKLHQVRVMDLMVLLSVGFCKLSLLPSRRCLIPGYPRSTKNAVTLDRRDVSVPHRAGRCFLFLHLNHVVPRTCQCLTQLSQYT